RLSISVAGFGAGGQSTFGQNTYVIPRTMGAHVGAGITYALSPRTQINIGAFETRVTNPQQKAYTTDVTLGLGRKMGPHWFLAINGGGSYTNVIQNSYGTPATRQIIGNVSLGYRFRAQTLIGSYNRSSHDEFGVAAGANSFASGAWNWHRTASNWMVNVNFGQ